MNANDTLHCTELTEEASRTETIRALYTELALKPAKDFGWGKGKENARALGYNPMWLEWLPAPVWESAAAVGNPFALGPICQGETVVDLGCGAGADACLAALLVGPKGRVLGVDMTLAMVQKARANAALVGLRHLEIFEADIAALPIRDACADVVISNGAINLAARKAPVLKEAFRVLKPGGRLYIADMARDPSIAPRQCSAESSDVSWANCVVGTVAPACFVQMLAEAGFVDAQVVATTGYRTAPDTVGATFRARKSA